jgi:hypothetical protein
MTQTITSKDTSLNQIPATFKRVAWVSGTVNFDIGAGKYDKFTVALNSVGVTNYSYDPFHLSEALNSSVLIETMGASDTATANNVLNVIAEKQARLAVISMAKWSLKPNGVAYFLIYEGDKSGIGTKTTKGYQCNKKAADYIKEISVAFNHCSRKGNLIIAKMI